MSTYPGGKSGAGVWQRLICEIPPVRTWISCCAGHCAVTRHLRPANRMIVVDLDLEICEWWSQFTHVEVWPGDCCEYLISRFHLKRPGSRGSAARYQTLLEKDPTTFVYADPPYPFCTRSKDRLYRHEFTDAQHRDLLDVLVALPCNVLVHSRPNPLYCAALDGWRSWTYEAMTRGGIATEQVWCNYQPPGELHDYRWIGGNKRVREKLARRRRNLIRRLRRLPDLERRQLLAAVADEFGGPAGRILARAS